MELSCSFVSRSNTDLPKNLFQVYGADQVSTWVTKQCRAYRGSDYLVNTAETSIVANDETYSLAA